jgi:hypothetical protein
MTSKFLAFYVFAGLIDASYVRARGHSCGAAKEKFSDTPDGNCIPCLRTAWQIDPMTGALTACWVDPSAHGCNCAAEP